VSEGLEGEIWSLKKHGPAYDAYTMRAWRSTWAAGFFTAAGILNRRSGCIPPEGFVARRFSCMRA